MLTKQERQAIVAEVGVPRRAMMRHDGLLTNRPEACVKLAVRRELSPAELTEAVTLYVATQTRRDAVQQRAVAERDQRKAAKQAAALAALATRRELERLQVEALRRQLETPPEAKPKRRSSGDARTSDNTGKQPDLTPEQVRERLNLPKVQAVLEWVNSGQLIAVNVNRSRTSAKPRWRISEEDLQAFLATRRTQPPAPRATRSRAKLPDVHKYF